MTATLALRIADDVIDLVSDLLKVSKRTSKPIPLGNWQSSRNLYSPAYYSTAANDPFYHRSSWKRIKVPLYGLGRTSIRTSSLTVPLAGTSFTWADYANLPANLPAISFRPPRTNAPYGRLNLRPPPYEMVIRTPPRGPGRTPEFHRRRKDQKIPYGVQRIYTLMHKALDEPSEWLEFMSTFWANFPDPAAITTALALNQAVDYAYGTRAQALKKHLYSHDLYTLPVGLDTLSRLWR